MNKWIALLNVVFLSLILVACGNSKPKLAFENDTLQVNTGDEFTLTPQLTDAAKDAVVEYTVNDPTIISYADGKFTALQAGQTTIVAKVKGYDDVTVTLTINVVNAEYTITYHLNGGVNGTNALTGFTSIDLPIELPIPSKEGYVFNGWYTTVDFSGESQSEVTEKENLVLYAKWKTPDLIVNASWSGEPDGDILDYKGISITIGSNGFATITEALASSSDGQTIYIAQGNYDEDVTIAKNDLTIVTANSAIDPTYNLRYEETVLLGRVSIASGVRNLSISGLAFTSEAYVTTLGAVSNLTFSYNYFYDTVSESVLLSLVGAGNQKHQNLIIKNNRFEADDNPTLIHIDHVENLNISDNYFRTANTSDADGVRIERLTGNDVSIEGNIFYNIYRYGIHIQKYLSNRIVIKSNIFNEIGTGAILVEAYVGTAKNKGEVSVEVLNNRFMWIDGHAVRVDHEGNATSSIHSIKVNYNIFTNRGIAFYFTTEGAGTAANLDFNYFSEKNPIETKLKGVASTNNLYSSDKEVQGSEKVEVIMPTELTILNPIESLDLNDEYQLQVKFDPLRTTFKDLEFKSSDTTILTVDENGLVKALRAGSATVTVSSVMDSYIKVTIELIVNQTERIELRYDGNGVLEEGESLELTYDLHIKSKDKTIVWSSSDESIATVDQNGVVTAVRPGTVTIKAKASHLKAEVGLTVFDPESASSLIQYLVEINRGVILPHDINYIGYQQPGNFPNRYYTSVSDYYYGPIEILKNMLPESRSNYSGVRMDSIEFITVHDTADAFANAKAISDYMVNFATTSWHYTVGNDAIYQQLEDHMRAAHAGDGFRKFELLDTGVKATSDELPTITIEERYYVVNGVKTDILIPSNAPDRVRITEGGIYTTIGDNGNYFMNRTYYNDGFRYIANHGGNANSIGIESTVNDGSDVHYTWQKTAKLVAQLLIKHDLEEDRVRFHNHFSGKDCPGTMFNSHSDEEFLALVHAEYHILKEYGDYTITLESHNKDIIDNEGRVVNAPEYTTSVAYTITVSNGTTTESITLHTLVQGTVND